VGNDQWGLSNSEVQDAWSVACRPPHASVPQGKFKFSLVNLIAYVSQIVSEESERMHKNSAVWALSFGPDIAYRLCWNHENECPC
jgi:hypothetical protein